ncbi:glycosyltransferase [Clostridium estertheticum]|uniref:glycosyltransferase n=1 Tax=Clostridium estertheticum TaxID=238834 RepID=UPI001C0CBA17|nr:glycosyltransferase [Clostridium estertheticum]MBU3197732.1 glycosyltransferase [Clostridium estertheticum]WAG65534.1 glycosyltransferase [Clostridium estertheticum]
MKVLQINSVCGYGSTGRIATDIYRILEEQGHECLIAYGRGTAHEGINSIKIGTKFDNYMHVAKTRLFDLHGFASRKATKEFIKKAKEYDPDVIHLHNIHGYYINIELLFNYLKETNKPVVWTLHDCWAFTGHCAYFDYVCCDKWKNGCDRCPQKSSYPQSLLKDNSKHNYANKKELFTGVKNVTIVTPSKWLSNLVKESFLKEYDVKVINNGIDLNVFNPKDKNIFRKKYNLEEKFIILGVASIWEERKGSRYFLEISKLIDKNSRIVLVGLNDKQLSTLPQNIIGIKRTNNIEELAEIYSAADVYVNPTLEDNFPTTNLEALACGTPVITFNTGGSVESVDESCGIVVKKGNIEGLFEIINKMNINKFDENDCIKMVKKFDKNDKFNEYIKLYMKR